MAELECIERRRMNMNRTWVTIIGTILVVIFVVWLLGGTKISCRESFWDKDKQVIEIKTD
jgi:hypothetical protein